MQANLDHVFIFIDVCDSVELKHGMTEQDANMIIANRLRDFEVSLQAADMNVRREGSSAGDSVFLVGHQLVPLFRACVMKQASWKGYVEGPPVRVAIGYGTYTPMADGLRSKAIDITHRILEKTPKAGVCVTESARVELQTAGLQDKLYPRLEVLKGFGPDKQSFYEADHFYLPPIGERQPIGDTIANEILAAAEAQKGQEPGVAGQVTVKLATPVPIQVEAPKHDIFWKVFAMVITVAVAALVFYLFYTRPWAQ